MERGINQTYMVQHMLKQFPIVWCPPSTGANLPNKDYIMAPASVSCRGLVLHDPRQDVERRTKTFKKGFAQNGRAPYPSHSKEASPSELLTPVKLLPPPCMPAEAMAGNRAGRVGKHVPVLSPKRQQQFRSSRQQLYTSLGV